MSNDYPIRFAAQMRQHMRALRKKRGLTQAQLGALVGVSQARIAEIEAAPGLVNLDQLLQLLAALGATFALEEQASASITPPAVKKAAPKTRRTSAAAASAQSGAVVKSADQPDARRPLSTAPKKGSW